MSSQHSDDARLGLASVILAVAALIAAASLLIAVLRPGVALASSWVGSLLQVLIALIGIVLAIALMRYIWSWTTVGILERLGRLEAKYRELAQRMSQRKPTFVSVAAVLALIIPFLFDKMIPDDDKATGTAVGLALIVLFWVSNELLISEGKFRFALGTVIWITGIAIPVFVFVAHESGDIRKMLAAVHELPPLTIAATVCSFLIACSAPFTLRED
jgi:hypothetical protein